MTLVNHTTAFLIDADNLSPAAVEEAFLKLADFPGALTVRRAYGGAEKLAGLREVLHRHAVRAFVNHGKGTTDVALAVDAIDLLHQAGPAVVAIGSGDGDFVPLVVRLREAGVRVLCFAQAGKAADDIAYAYDAVIHVGGRGQGASGAQPMHTGAGTATATGTVSGASVSAGTGSGSGSAQSGRPVAAPPAAPKPRPDAAAPSGSRSGSRPAPATAPGASRQEAERGRNRDNGSRADRRPEANAGSRTGGSRAETRGHERIDTPPEARSIFPVARTAASDDRGAAPAEPRADRQDDDLPTARAEPREARASRRSRGSRLRDRSQARDDSRAESRADAPAADRSAAIAAHADAPAPATQPTAMPASATEPAPAPVPAPAPAPAPAAARAPEPAPVADASPAPATTDREAVDQVRRLLAAIPDWKTGATRQLNSLGTPLQEAGLRKGGKPLHELFRKLPDYFEVLPRTGQARQVRLLRQPD